METIAATIVPGAERMLGLAEALLKDVGVDRFARFASPGGQVVTSNHPAFVYGHLALYPARIVMAAGEDPGEVAAPEGYAGLFGAGVACVDDPAGSIYPSMDEIVSVFFDRHRRVLEMVKRWPDSRLAGGHALEGRLAELFPRVGQVANFLLLGHAMMHLGQVSAWRRAVGLGSAM
jgi:hypothetical protein